MKSISATKEHFDFTFLPLGIWIEIFLFSYTKKRTDISKLLHSKHMIEGIEIMIGIS